jgi:hypothetical protein
MNKSTNKKMTARSAVKLLLALAIVSTSGCAIAVPSYVERHEIHNLTIVFLDQASLQEEWKKRTGQLPARLVPIMNSTIPVVKTVNGFFDYATNTLYCPKWNFEICGHELHHAALGQFHPAH